MLVLLAAGLPVFLAFFAWILDFGNATVHRRHLQTQADAGVLAAAQQIGSLSNCTSSHVIDRALQYAGAMEYAGSVAGVGEPLRNVPRQQESHAVVNDLTYFNQPEKVDPTYPPALDDVGPCEARMIDVKTTQQDLPRFIPALPGFSFGPTLSFLNAHARVRFETVTEARGLLPVGVPETRPRKAKVTFINPADGSVLASKELFEGDAEGSLGIWSNADDPVAVPIEIPNVHVRVTLSGSNSLTCGDPLVSCYDSGSTTTGLSHIRGYTSPGAPGSAFQVGDVRLTAGSCGEAYFNPAADASCTIGLVADIVPPSPEPSNMRVYAAVGADRYLLSRSGNTFTTAASGIPVATAAGPKDITLRYRSGTCDRTNCEVALPGGTVQRTFRGSAERSGPVQLVRVAENGVAGANSFPRCAGCTRSLVVTVGIEGSLKISQPGDPTVALRITGNGSRTQALDCDPAIANLKDELALGCAPGYVENQGTACPNSVFGTEQPWDCVNVQTGSATNQIPAGLNFRILGDEQADTCTSPNNWPTINVGDPRILTVFLTPFGVFSSSGSGAVPVAGFASFYVTGWTGQGNGFTNPCAASEGGTDDPPPDSSAGWMVGHFIDYVLPGGGNGSGEECPSGGGSPNLCVAVLTE